MTMTHVLVILAIALLLRIALGRHVRKGRRPNFDACNRAIAAARRAQDINEALRKRNKQMSAANH